MKLDLNRAMQETMRLMQAGDLPGAVLAIQQGLQGTESVQNARSGASGAPPASLEAEYRVLRDTNGAQASETISVPQRDRDHAPEGEFRDHDFICDAGSIRYKLFIPAGADTTALPLIVMLHGCTQSPDDFARGTRMNALAQEHGYLIAYPAQANRNNASKCWNWFRSSDQRRGTGEPALLAALTRHLVTTHGLDQRRVYVAGLSAGGAMAAVLAATYPDVYAAIGIHSGLPFGVAHDVASAFAAMKQPGGMSVGAAPTLGAPVPTIVFHGDRDTTVTAGNAAAIIEQSIGAANRTSNAELALPRASVERGLAGGRRYTRTLFTNATGAVIAEQWLVHGAGHAWFGGDPAGSYADPAGPNASEHMLRFFSNASGSWR
ncbi:MAG TPA: PHB depolymerase family esterase [Burkholderiales bacterium]|nr:PHB depolymerase family esterase [Burkholderiales bacterium]